MANFNGTGTYIVPSPFWWTLNESGQTNFQRWVTAHATVLGDLPNAASYQPRSWKFMTASTFSPTNDVARRLAAHNAGLARTMPDGKDFLYLGNYVSPTATVSKINGVSIPNGKLYWAGQPLGIGGWQGSIVRNGLEVISTADLTSLCGLIAGNNYTIQVTGI